MIVLRSTMEAAVDAERERGDKRLLDLARQYGEALRNVVALQQQMAAWITGKTEGAITPEQFADMFYANDDRWQAAFFNAMQDRVTARHGALPADTVWGKHPGVPAGESQWWYMAQHLDDSGFETIEAMFDHAKSAREQERAA